MMSRRLLTALILVAFQLSSIARVTVAAAVAAEANRVAEIRLVALRDHDDPFNSLTVDAVFTDVRGLELRVPAFWSGGRVWKVRYASPFVGLHRYRTECSDQSERGLHGVTGEVQVTAYRGDNPMYLRGPIRVAADHRHLEHADGTPFFWLADTWWMGLCDRLHWPTEFQMLVADRKAKGFNVIQIVVGLYPDMHPFDRRGANEDGFPWEEKYERIRPEYFDAADRRFEYLVDQGFSPCIVGAWGYFMPWMGVAKTQQHWRYLIARYGALPVTWCAAGEANLPWYLAKNFPYDDREQVTRWTEVMRYIRDTDPYHRPLTVHPTGIGRLSARHATDDVALLDFDMLQTPHGERGAVEPTVRTTKESYADKPTLPVINGEAAYEQLFDKLGTEWTRQMFWLCMTNGAAGHTYGANGIWQCNRPGEPHGPSPHHQGGVGYGAIPWSEAMNFPGSRQVGLGKKLFERFDWQNFTPHPEWATFAAATSDAQPRWGKWIWFPEGGPTRDAPVAARYFRKTFELVADGDQRPRAGTLWISADDQVTVYLNGQEVGRQAGTGTFAKLDVSRFLVGGRNVLAVTAANKPAAVAANPAGLLVSMEIRLNDKTVQYVHSDKSWHASRNVADSANWIGATYDDARWAAAKELGEYGCLPWGVFTPAPAYGPFATGIAEKVRIVYVPASRPVQMAQLEAGVKYQMSVFDPATGETNQIGRCDASDDESSIVHKPPQVSSDDWVILLERIH